MLKTRIIPCLDVKDGRVVKGINFVDLIDAGDPVAQAKLYDEAGADELCLLDITASSDDRTPIYDVIARVAEQCFMPLTVGGGVRTVDDIRALLLAGADKVSINSAAVSDPDLVRRAADKFGSQCVVVAMDAKRRPGSGIQDSGNATPESRIPNPEPFQIFTHGGRTPTGIDAIEWAQRMTAYGAGELLVTSMDRDGTKAGYDIPLTRAIAEAVTVPVIASGGVGLREHFVEGARAGATGLLAASVFHFGTFTIAQVKQAMADAGVPVRR